MKCSACGTRLAKGATFCPTCYTPTGAPTATATTTGAIPATAVPRLTARPRRRGRVAALAVATLGVVAVAIVGALTLTRRAAAPQAIPPIGAFAYPDLAPWWTTFQSATQPERTTQAGRSLANYEYWALVNGSDFYNYTVTVWDNAAAAQAASTKSYTFYMKTSSPQVWAAPAGEYLVVDRGQGTVYATTSSNTVSVSFETGGSAVGAVNNVPLLRQAALTIMQRVRQRATAH